MSDPITESRALTALAAIIVIVTGWLFHLIAESQRSYADKRESDIHREYEEFEEIRKDISELSQRIKRLETFKELETGLKNNE